MVTTLPTPLPPHSHKLREGRWEVDVSRPSARRAGSWVVHTTGRFVTEAAARRWAEGVRTDGERAGLTRCRATEGWQRRAVDTLTDDGWKSSPR